MIYLLASTMPGLFGCGSGGGGSPASAPPAIGAPGIGSGLDEGHAADFLAELEGDGEPWIGLIEADSARLVLKGQNPETNAVLSKVPLADLTSESYIPSQYSRFAHFISSLDAVHEPGRYMLWGKLTPLLPVEGGRYTMQGAWTCTGCNGDASVDHGRLDGEINVNFVSLDGTTRLAGDGLEFSAGLELSKHHEIKHGLDVSARYNAIDQVIDTSVVTGGVFGPNAEEAGILFGFTSGSRVFTGTALGHHD